MPSSGSLSLILEVIGQSLNCYTVTHDSIDRQVHVHSILTSTIHCHCGIWTITDRHVFGVTIGHCKCWTNFCTYLIILLLITVIIIVEYLLDYDKLVMRMAAIQPMETFDLSKMEWNLHSWCFNQLLWISQSSTEGEALLTKCVSRSVQSYQMVLKCCAVCVLPRNQNNVPQIFEVNSQYVPKSWYWQRDTILQL